MPAVIAFGAAIGGAEAYRRYGQRGVELAAESDSVMYAFASVQPIGRTYNLMLEAAAKQDDLEALVLLHPHTEIVDAEFCSKVRRALADPTVGIVGCAGANGVRSIAWWEGAVVAASGAQRYGDYGGGELPAISWTQREPPPAEVEVLDGQLLVLSPWVVRNQRFDEAMVLDHGFDVDFGLQIRAAGRKLLVADLRVVHHRSLELIADLEVWVEAHIRVAEKWNGVLSSSTDHEPSAPDDERWKRRARVAEARREAARAIAFSQALLLDARVLELERALEEKTDSLSWRATAPLRVLNRRRKQAAERRSAP